MRIASATRFYHTQNSNHLDKNWLKQEQT